MPRHYTMGGRAAPSSPQPGGAPPAPRSLRERFGALRNLPPFLKLVWRTSPSLTAADLLLRLVRALLPVATLFVGKLIIDEVVRLAQLAGAPDRLADWLASGLLDRLGWLLAAELALAVLSDVLGRVVSLLDALLSEQFSNATSVRLMEHAATLDLEDFEDSDLQDRLDRARRQTMGRMALLSQLFGQAQRTRGPSRGRSARASGSRTSASATRAPSAGRCATSPSPCAPARCWRWSARTAPARRRW